MEDKDVDEFLKMVIGEAPTRPIQLGQTWMAETVAKTSIPCDLVILPTDNLVAVCERKKARIVIYGEEGKEVRVLDREDITGLRQPTALAMIDHRMLVADVNQVHFMNSTSWLEDRTMVPRKRLAPSASIQGMCVNSFTEELVTTETSVRAAVNVWDIHSERFKFALKPPKTKPFKKPQYVACSMEGDIYVSDCEAHCVYMFDKKGKYISMLGTKGDKKLSFIYPAGIDITGKGEVLVADPPNGSVFLFDLKGQYRYPILDTLDEVNQPVAVRFRDGNFAVIEEILEHGKDRNIVRLFHMSKGKGH